MVALALGWLLTQPAAGSDIDPFDPAASLATGQGGLQAEAPQLGREGLSGGLVAAFAQDPVVRRFDDGTDSAEVAALAPLHAHAGWTVDDRVRVDVALPVYAWVDAPLTAFRGAAVGDLRLQATVPLWSSETDDVHFAVVPRLGVPTGTADAVVAQGIHADLIASLGGRASDVGWVVNGGFRLAGNDPLEGSDRGLGHTFDAVGSAWWTPNDALRLGAEIDLSAGLAAGPDGGNHTGGVHAFAQNVLPSGLGLLVAAGTGLIAGLGTPDYRVLGALTWAPRVSDQDGDGITDDLDDCSSEPEDMDGFRDLDGCPDPDNDADGLLDLADTCPDDAEDLDGFADDDGCPDDDNDDDTVADGADLCPMVPGPVDQGGCPDRDADGLADSDDACPDDFGPVELQGCPDSDGDGVPDVRDRCPDVRSPPDEDPAISDGCPKTVYVSRTEIRILQHVEFETGHAAIRAASTGLLDKVAEVLLDNPYITMVEVQGHTDNVGSETYNLGLSERRATSVMSYLVQQGIDRARLLSRGYGESLPMFSNRTPEGKANNRRVQFKILEQVRTGPDPDAPTPTLVPIDPDPEPETAPTEGSEGSPWVTTTPLVDP